MKPIYRYILFVFSLILTCAFFAFDLQFSLTSDSGAGVLVALAPLIALVHDEDVENMGGFTNKAFLVRVSDVVSIPTATNKKITTDIVLAATKLWIPVYCTPEKGGLTGEPDGPRDGQFFRFKGTGLYPNINANSLQMADIALNGEFLVIMKELSGEGNMYLLGSLEIGVTIKPTVNMGTAYADQRGLSFEYNWVSGKTANIYSGAVATS
jgi:hypothetical protein